MNHTITPELIIHYGQVQSENDRLRAELRAADDRATEYINALSYARAELAELRKQLEAAESRLREIDAALPVAWLIDDGRNAPWFCESDFLAERYGGDAKPMILRPARWSKQEGV